MMFGASTVALINSVFLFFSFFYSYSTRLYVCPRWSGLGSVSTRGGKYLWKSAQPKYINQLKKTMIKSSVLVKVALGFSHSTFAKYFTRKQFDIETTVTGFWDKF